MPHSPTNSTPNSQSGRGFIQVTFPPPHLSHGSLPLLFFYDSKALTLIITLTFSVPLFNKLSPSHLQIVIHLHINVVAGGLLLVHALHRYGVIDDDGVRREKQLIEASRDLSKLHPWHTKDLGKAMV